MDVQHTTLPKFFFQNDAEFKESRKAAGQGRYCVAFTTGNEEGGVGCGAFIHFKASFVNTGRLLIAYMAHELCHWWLMRIQRKPDFADHGEKWQSAIRMFYTLFDGHLAHGEFPRTPEG